MEFAGLVRVNSTYFPWPDRVTAWRPDASQARLVWVGRLEIPKDPQLAVRAFAHLALENPDEPWTLEIIGSGALRPVLEQQIAALPATVAERITLRGRLAPPEVAAAWAEGRAIPLADAIADALEVGAGEASKQD